MLEGSSPDTEALIKHTNIRNQNSTPFSKISKEPTPAIQVSDIESRSLFLKWLIDPVEQKTKYAQCNYQITKSQLDKLKFEVVYEGELPYCKILHLVPETEYKFVLRFQLLTRFSPSGLKDYIWSQEQSDVTVKTGGLLI